MSVKFADVDDAIYDLTEEYILRDYLKKKLCSALYYKLKRNTIFKIIEPFKNKIYYKDKTLDLGLLSVEYDYTFPSFSEIMDDAELSVTELDEEKLTEEINEIDVTIDARGADIDWEDLTYYVEANYSQELEDARNNVDQDDYVDEDGDLNEDAYYEAQREAEDEVLSNYYDEYVRQLYNEAIELKNIEEALKYLDGRSSQKVKQYIVLKALFGDVIDYPSDDTIEFKDDAELVLDVSEYDIVSSVLPVPAALVPAMKENKLALKVIKDKYAINEYLLDNVQLIVKADDDTEEEFGSNADSLIELLSLEERLEAIGKLLTFKPSLKDLPENRTRLKNSYVAAAEGEDSFAVTLTKEGIHTTAVMSCLSDKIDSRGNRSADWLRQLTIAMEASERTPSFPKDLVLTFKLSFDDVAFMTTGGTKLESVYNDMEFDRPLIRTLGLVLKPTIEVKILAVCMEQPYGTISLERIKRGSRQIDGIEFVSNLNIENEGELAYSIPDGCTIDLRSKSDFLIISEFNVVAAERNLYVKKLFASNMGDTRVAMDAIDRVIYCDELTSEGSFKPDYRRNYKSDLKNKIFNSIITKDHYSDYSSTYNTDSVRKVDGSYILTKSSSGDMDGKKYALYVVDLVSPDAVSALYNSRGPLRDYVIIKESNWEDSQPVSPLFWDASGRYLKYNWPSTISQDRQFLTFLYGDDSQRWDANVAYDIPERNKPAIADDINLISNIGNLSESAQSLNATLIEMLRDSPSPREYPFDSGVLNLLGYSKAAIAKLNEGDFKKLKMATNTNFLAAYYSYGNFINITNRGREYLGSLDRRYTETTVFSLQSAFNDMGVRGFTEVFTTSKGILPYIVDGNAYMHSGSPMPHKDTFLDLAIQGVYPASKARSRSVCFKLMYSIMETLTRPIVLLKNHISTLSQLESRPNPLDLDAKNEQFSSKGYYNAKTIEEDFIDSLKSIFDSVEYDGDKQLALFSKAVKYGSDRVLVTKLHAYKRIELDFSTVESTQRMLDEFTFSFNALALKEIFPVSMVEDQVLVNEGDTIKDMLLGAYPDLTDQQKEYLEYHISNYFSRHKEDMLEEVVLELNKLVTRTTTNFVSSYPERGIVDDNVFFEGGESDILVYSNSRETLESMTAYDRNLEAIRYGAITIMFNNIMLKLTEIFSLYDGKEQTEKRDIFAAALKGESGHINMVNVLNLLENPVAGTKEYNFFASNKIKAGKSTVEGVEVAYPMYNALIEDKNPIDYWSISQIIGCPRNKTITARYPDTNKTEERLSLFRYIALVETVYNSMKEFTGEGKDALGPTIAQYKDLKMTYITANEGTQIQSLITLGTAYKVCFGSSGMGYRAAVQDDKAEFLSITRKNRPRTFIYLNNAVISESKGIDNESPFTLKKKAGYGSWRDFMLQAQDLKQLKSILDRIQNEYNLEELAFLAVALTEAGVASGALPAETSARKYHIDNMINLYALACLDYYNFKNAGAPDEHANQYLNGLLHHLGLEMNDTADMMDAYSAFDDLVDAIPFEDILGNIEVEDTLRVSEDWKKLG